MSAMTTISEVARRLHVTVITVQSWQAGTTRYRPIPTTIKMLGKTRRMYFAVPDLLEWLEQNRPDLLHRWETHDASPFSH